MLLTDDGGARRSFYLKLHFLAGGLDGPFHDLQQNGVRLHFVTLLIRRLMLWMQHAGMSRI